jgi:signal transduction histidine kinase/AraC-like DNA-binding protein
MVMANLPGRLVGINRHQEQERLLQLETSLAISRRVGSILDREQLYHEIVDLVRANYGYDEAQIFIWSPQEREFVLDKLGTEDSTVIRIPLAESGLLGHTFLHNQPTFIPEMRQSLRFPPDPYWPTTRSRVIVPIHQGSETIGLLDLHSHGAIYHSSNALIGLQALADQLGTALRNVELFGEAVAARGEAERANQLKSRLLANISHEFRTPLNVIEGYSQTALATPGLYGIELPSALQKDMRHIYGSAKHLERLVNDLLDLSQAEIGELDIFPEPVDPRSIIQETFESMAGSGKAKPAVAWRLQVPESLPETYADPGRLRQILLNLLSNASKFTDTGHIAFGAQAQPGFVHFWIEDTGCGIAPELQERIFETFSTAEQPKEPGQGIGLGLRVTYELVKAHDGRIWLESTPGVGSTFHVALPIYAPEGQRNMPEAPQSSAPPAVLPGENADLPPQVSALVRQAVAYMHDHCGEAISREEIAEALGVSANYFSRVFRRELGLSPWQYLSRLRIMRAKKLLADSDMSVTDVAIAVGFSDTAYFSRVFRKEAGRSPQAYRRQIR